MDIVDIKGQYFLFHYYWSYIMKIIFLSLLVLATLSISLQAQIPTDGLILYYPFNGNSIDESGNGYNATVNGAVLTTDRFGYANSAYEFDGNDDNIYFSDANQTLFNSGQEGYTICGWFNTYDIKLFPQDIFNTEPHRVIALEYKHWVDADKYTPYFIGDGNNWSAIDYGSKSDYIENEWYFFTITKNGENYKLFINSILNGEVDVPVAQDFQTNVTGFYLGSISWNSQFFKGKLDDYRIYNRALNECEISELYNEFGEIPEATITVTPLKTMDPGGEENTIYIGYGAQEVTLEAILDNTNVVSYEWSSEPVGLSSNDKKVPVSPSQNTIYTVLITNEFGCTFSKTIEIKVVDVSCGNNDKNDKVKICHKGKAICVSRNALSEHLSHGDYLGDCRNNKESSEDYEFDKNKDYEKEMVAKLMQNYPNPFSSTSNIEYSLPEAGFVSLKIYDIYSREVAVLVNQTQSAGSYNIEFESANLPCGIYIYRLDVNGISLSKQMIILK
jgi:hypothetical protein